MHLLLCARSQARQHGHEASGARDVSFENHTMHTFSRISDLRGLSSSRRAGGTCNAASFESTDDGTVSRLGALRNFREKGEHLPVRGGALKSF